VFLSQMCGRVCVSITNIVICVILFLLSGWYWYYVAVAIPVHDVAAIVVYVISAFVLILLATLGIVAVIKRFENLLLYFAAIMMVMFVFGLIQLALVIYSSRDCKNTNNPFTFICGLTTVQAAWQYWLPSATILLANILAFTFSLILKKIWTGEEGGGNNNYY